MVSRRKTVLIVDDEEDILEILEDMLSGYENMQIIKAQNGLEAINKIEKQEFDLMITDIGMPKMDGITLIKTIRGDKSFPNFPIIVLSGSLDKKTVQDLIVMKKVKILAKPLDDDKFKSTVDGFIA